MFVFTGLWFGIGVVLLMTPIPGALGIGDQMFVAWLLLFLTILALSGATLTMAAINGMFPQGHGLAASTAAAAVSAPAVAANAPAVAANAPIIAPAIAGAAANAPAGTPAQSSADDATTDGDGNPLPWSQSPLPVARRSRWGARGAKTAGADRTSAGNQRPATDVPIRRD